MALIRPQGRLEPEQEQNLETTILGELEQLNQKVSAIGDGQHYMRVALFGGRYNDIDHVGKLPTFDTSLTAHESRIISLERDRDNVKTAIRTAAWIGGLVGGASATIATLLVEIFTHK